MILRRITEHVKAQNWTAVTLDFFIVVVGVFIGIQVANWNDARGDRARETQYLADLYSNLTEDREEFAKVKATIAARVGAINYVLMEALGEEPPSGIALPTGAYSAVATTEIPFPEGSPPAQENLDSLWAVMNFVRRAASQSGTYDALVNSGDIGLMRDHDLVKALHKYYDLSDGLIGVQDTFFSFGDDGLIGAGRLLGLSPYESVEAPKLIALTRDTPEFAVMLRQARQQAALQSRLMAGLDDRAEALVALIEERDR